jgi:ABC-type dipeptide/oligopeptide/nickel transport system permease component
MAPEITVTQLIFKQWPYSALVGGLAAGFAVTLGIILGAICAARQNSWVDTVISTYAVISGTVPNFVLGFVLIYFFAARLGWFPSGGWGGLNARNLILPVVAFGLPAAGGVARWTRQCMLEAMSSEYVRTAYAKGVRQTGVMSRHVLRNALIPMVTAFLPLFPDMMTGSIFIEKTFGIPGLGQYFVNSSFSRDYTLVLGITMWLVCSPPSLPLTPTIRLISVMAWKGCPWPIPSAQINSVGICSPELFMEPGPCCWLAL